MLLQCLSSWRHWPTRIGAAQALLLTCLAGTGLFAVLAPLSPPAPIQFTIWRVLTGLFAARRLFRIWSPACRPEIAPRRLRATFSTITVVCGAQGGTLIGAAMQAFILAPLRVDGSAVSRLCAVGCHYADRVALVAGVTAFHGAPE